MRNYDDSKHLQLIPQSMRQIHSETLYFTMTLEDAQARSNLLAMTPHGWRANAQKREAVINQTLTTTVAIRYDWIEKTGN